MTPSRRQLLTSAAAIGPQRCYWGIDVTNGYAQATYRQRLTQFTEELSFLSEADKDWIMGRAIVARSDDVTHGIPAQFAARASP